MAKTFGGRPAGAHRFLLACPEVGPKGNLSPLSVLSAGGWRVYLFSYLRALLASDRS
jgi:hypothetical protein